MNKIVIVFFLFCSNVLFGQQTIKNLQWLHVDQEIDKLTVDSGLTLYAETENIDDGEVVTITIWNKVNEADELVGEYLTRVTENKIMFHWILIFDEEKMQDSLREIETQGFTKPKYYFSMQYQRIKSQNSRLLSVRAWIRQKFVAGRGPNAEPWAFKKYTLIMPDDSEIVGWTDAEGNIRPETDIELFGKILWFLHRDTGEEPEIWPPYQLPEKPIYYTIKEDDTLRKIASYDFIYDDPYLWNILYEANKHNFIHDDLNSNLIEPGRALIIPPRTGETRNGTR